MVLQLIIRIERTLPGDIAANAVTVMIATETATENITGPVMPIAGVIVCETANALVNGKMTEKDSPDRDRNPNHGKTLGIRGSRHCRDEPARVHKM